MKKYRQDKKNVRAFNSNNLLKDKLSLLEKSKEEVFGQMNIELRPYSELPKAPSNVVQDPNSQNTLEIQIFKDKIREEFTPGV